MMRNRSSKVFAIILCILMCLVFLPSCKKDDPKVEDSSTQTDGKYNSTDSLLLFKDNAYTADIVYTATSDHKINILRTELSSALRQKTGTAPTLKRDNEVEISADKIEILFGNTNRDESLRPSEFDANDAWYYVGVIGNKLVINGTNSYMLKLAVRVFIEEILGEYNGGTLAISANVSKTYCLKDYCHNGWKLPSIPYYKGEKSSFAYQTYDSGTTITNAVELDTENAEMMIVSDTTSEEFEAYLTRLKDFGFAEKSRTEMEGNLFATYSNENDSIYLYYTAGTKRVRVILDNVSASIQDFSYTTVAKDNEGAEFYLYGLNMTPYEKKPENINTGVIGYPNNGMMLVIKTADNSVMIVDGGNEVQMTGTENSADVPMEKLNAFLHQITGKSKEEKITISCWILTHAHADHSGGFYNFIRQYADQYTLERICANIPSYTSLLSTNEKNILNGIGRFVKSQWKDCKEIKIHTGQSFQLSDVVVQAIYTQEDNVDSSTAKTKLTSRTLNDSSIILKVSTAKMSMMILGDTDSATESIILNSFSTASLHVDLVQVAHHGFNPLERLYRAISAPFAIYPQSYGYMQRDEEIADLNKRLVTGQILKYASKENIYYAGKYENTVGFTYRNGGIVILTPCAENS